ncbi:MAG: hypothetical protein QXY45_00065 [Candidatus Aenigmatarchaeota archaeon]
MSEEMKNLLNDRKIKTILRILFKEKEAGKPGISISQLSKKTGIERHKLSGIIDVLTLLGVIMIFQMGMVKMVTINPQNIKTFSHLFLINSTQRTMKF